MDWTARRLDGWTSKCARGYARFLLSVWAGGGVQAASCRVISATLPPPTPHSSRPPSPSPYSLPLLLTRTQTHSHSHSDSLRLTHTLTLTLTRAQTHSHSYSLSQTARNPQSYPIHSYSAQSYVIPILPYSYTETSHIQTIHAQIRSRSYSIQSHSELRTQTH